MHPNAPQRSPRRAGFTLVEMLVVIAIIVVLVALSAAGYFYAMGNQQRRNTESTFQAVQKTLDRHWQFVVAEAKKEPIPDPVKAFANVNYPNPDPTDPTGARPRVLWVKIRLMEAFPASYSEVVNPADPVYQFLATVIPGNRRKNSAIYARAIVAARGKGVNTAVNPATESSALLLMSLSMNRSGTSLKADDLDSQAVRDTDNDGIKEILDGWQRPIVFYRFAWTKSGAQPDVQKFNPATSGPGVLRADPQDTDGHLLTWPNGPGPLNKALYQTLFHQIAYTGPPAGAANYTIPVMVSAGPDGLLDIFPPTQCAVNGMVANGTGWVDNLYSFTLRVN
jgi:prepilin-type N-terminal cleavage/methylation domain-containing protein